MHPKIIIVALFIIAKIWKQSKHQMTDEWIKKMWYIYTMEYIYIHTHTQPLKKRTIMPSVAT